MLSVTCACIWRCSLALTAPPCACETAWMVAEHPSCATTVHRTQRQQHQCRQCLPPLPGLQRCFELAHALLRRLQLLCYSTHCSTHCLHRCPKSECEGGEVLLLLLLLARPAWMLCTLLEHSRAAAQRAVALAVQRRIRSCCALARARVHAVLLLQGQAAVAASLPNWQLWRSARCCWAEVEGEVRPCCVFNGSERRKKNLSVSENARSSSGGRDAVSRLLREYWNKQTRLAVKRSTQTLCSSCSHAETQDYLLFSYSRRDTNKDQNTRTQDTRQDKGHRSQAQSTGWMTQDTGHKSQVPQVPVRRTHNMPERATEQLCAQITQTECNIAHTRARTNWKRCS
jgi:hypothetical protein